MCTTTHSLSKQTFCWSDVALKIPDALPDEYHWSFCCILNSRPFVPKLVAILLHHGGHFIVRCRETNYMIQQLLVVVLPQVSVMGHPSHTPFAEGQANVWNHF